MVAYHHKDHRAAYAFAALAFDDNKWQESYGWCPATSSFDAEMRAIKSAIKFATTHSSAKSVAIIIDNKAAANALFSFDIKSSQMLVVRINILLSAWLSQDKTRHLTIRFALSHQGIPGNERADRLTKAGLALCPTNPPTILQSHFIGTHRHEAEQEWQHCFRDPTYRGSQWLLIRQRKKKFKPAFSKTARNFFHGLAQNEPSHLSRIAHAITNHAPTGE